MTGKLPPSASCSTNTSLVLMVVWQKSSCEHTTYVEKPPLVQVAGDYHHKYKGRISRWQENTTRAQALTRTCPCATCIWLLLLVPWQSWPSASCTGWCFFLSLTSVNTYSLVLVEVITCHWWWFFLCQLAHLLMYTNTYGRALQFALCGGGGVLYKVYIYILYVPSLHRKCCYNIALNH